MQDAGALLLGLLLASLPLLHFGAVAGHGSRAATTQGLRRA
jgi:hypothetical protein